jgi:hypothetical protein
MRKLILGLAFAAPFAAHADCTCMCLNGQVRAVCENKLDKKPFCPKETCPYAPPLIPQKGSPKLSPTEGKTCQQFQVYDPNYKQYVWRMACTPKT